MELLSRSSVAGWKLRLQALRRVVVRPTAFRGLWRHRDFMHLWMGQSISQLGSTMTREALPLIAILMLNATPIQMGLLGAAGTAPVLVLGLLAGVWVDRLRRRSLMIATDLGRAVLLLSVPLAYFLGYLNIGQLYLVAALVGCLTVLFDVAYQSYLPTLVTSDELVEGNSKLGLSGAMAESVGPPLGGLLVQAVSGPITVLLDALSFVFSAVMLRRVRTQELPPVSVLERQHIWHDLVEGLRAIWSNPLLRPLALSMVVRSFFGWFFGAIYGLYGLQHLGLSPALLGITVACGGIGAFGGALLVGPIARHLHFGGATVVALVVSSSSTVLIWLAGGWLFAAVPLMITAQIVGDLGGTLGAINEVSLRQTIVPDRLLGRVNAGMRVMNEGIGTLGLLVGGVFGQVIGLRSTVAIAAIGSLLGCLWLVSSPLVRLRRLPAAKE